MARKNTSTEMTQEQQIVFASFQKGANIFLCGKGGTGKSFLTRHIIDYCKSCGKQMLVCAPTGVAATNINGVTIHRTFGIPIRLIAPDEFLSVKPDDGEKRRKYVEKKLKVIRNAEVIIIDEISMCRIDTFAWVANTLMHENPNVQILVVGDFYQLPPVGPKQKKEKETFFELYGNRLYAFQSRQWADLGFVKMELQTSMRQKEKAFINALNQIREGKPAFNVFKASKELDTSAVTICPTNDTANHINNQQIQQLENNGARVFEIETTTKIIDENFKISDKDYPVEKTLILCEGAKVVMLNNDSDGLWVNGSIATVLEVCINGQNGVEDYIRVEVNGAHAVIKKHTWDINDHILKQDKHGKSVIEIIPRAAIIQFPVRLAWGMTVHKSQGQTYGKVNVLADGFFADGQMYVALSRCKTLEGMRIIGTLKQSELKCSEAVINYMHGNYNHEDSPTLLASGSLENAKSSVSMEDSEENTPGTIDRYQEGWDDGYVQGTDDTDKRWQDKIAQDKSIRILSERTVREAEKEELPEEVRNPRGAGRKKKPINEQHPSKAIRVPCDLADVLKKIGDYCKEKPDAVPQVIEQCNKILTNFCTLN